MHKWLADVYVHLRHTVEEEIYIYQPPVYL
jgi:hypothetical protein